MDLMKMMKQAQEIQGRMQKVQEELVGLEVEGHAYEKLRLTDDYREGIAAFSEKRKPKFKREL